MTRKKCQYLFDLSRIQHVFDIIRRDFRRPKNNSLKGITCLGCLQYISEDTTTEELNSIGQSFRIAPFPDIKSITNETMQKILLIIRDLVLCGGGVLFFKRWQSKGSILVKGIQMTRTDQYHFSTFIQDLVAEFNSAFEYQDIFRLKFLGVASRD